MKMVHIAYSCKTDSIRILLQKVEKIIYIYIDCNKIK